MAVADPSREAVRRLAQYRPFDEGGRSQQAMLQELVLAAAALNGGAFASLATCQQGIRDLWELEFELDELREAREALQATAQIASERGGFALTTEAAEKLEARAQASAQTEDEALQDWRRTLHALRPDLADDDFSCLCSDLRDWLNHLIVRHGLEAAMLLYPEDERAHAMFEKVEQLGTEFLPERGGLVGQIRDEALRRFVRQATPSQRAFLANRMNTAFYLTVLTLDPEAKGLVQARAQGRRIYLDTNFLYAVLGKASATEVASAHRLLELTKGLGIQTAVTRWTIDELRKSIQTARRNAERMPMPREFAQVVLAGVGEKGYSAAFWRDYHQTGMRPQDWFDRAEHFETDLSELGIDTVEEGCTAIDQNRGLVNEYASLLDRVITYDRHDHVLEHDAKHRLLVERLRGEGHLTFSNARYWFLTQDNQLMRFAGEMPDPDDEAPDLPFCISPSAWLQIVRALTPRTENFDETVVTLLTSPYVGYGPTVDQRTIREVVARIDAYDDASPELAIEVLEDSALVRDIAQASDEEMEERVRRAYSAKTKELQERAETSAAAAETERLRREAAEAREREIERDLEHEKRRREGAQADAERARQEREELEQRVTVRIEEAEQRAEASVAEERAKRETLEKEIADRQRRRKRNLRVGGGIALAVIGVVMIAIAYVLDELHGTGAVASLGVGAFCFALLGIRIALGSRWGGEVVGWIFGIAGLVGTVLGIIALTQQS